MTGDSWGDPKRPSPHSWPPGTVGRRPSLILLSAPPFLRWGSAGSWGQHLHSPPASLQPLFFESEKRKPDWLGRGSPVWPGVLSFRPEIAPAVLSSWGPSRSFHPAYTVRDLRRVGEKKPLFPQKPPIMEEDCPAESAPWGCPGRPGQGGLTCLLPAQPAAPSPRSIPPSAPPHAQLQGGLSRGWMPIHHCVRTELRLPQVGAVPDC